MQTHLNRRLLPWAQHQGYTLITVLDDYLNVEAYVKSWTRLIRPGMNDKPGDLDNRTKHLELKGLKSFLQYCVDRQLLKNNHARKIKITFDEVKKFGLEFEEQSRFFEAIKQHHQGWYDPHELYVFCKSMRIAGLRISDASQLCEEQLVENASGDGWALNVFQKKTKQWVYIPITPELAQELRELPFKAEKDGTKYWFLDGDLNSVCHKFAQRINSIVNNVAEDHPLRHDVTPHCLRHTFAIRHLNACTPLKTVSRWLGHKTTATTDKAYSHAIQSTDVASDESFRESMKRQDEMRQRAMRRKMTVV